MKKAPTKEEKTQADVDAGVACVRCKGNLGDMVPYDIGPLGQRFVHPECTNDTIERRARLAFKSVHEGQRCSADVLLLLAEVRRLEAEIAKLRAPTIESLAIEIAGREYMTIEEAINTLKDDIACGLEENGSWQQHASGLGSVLTAKLDAFVEAERAKKEKV